MKNKFLGLSLFLFALIGLVSCDTEPLDNGLEPTNPTTNNGAFSVKFNNGTYSTNSVSAIAIQGAITLTAEHSSGIFVFGIEGDQVGTYSGSDLSMTYITPSGETYTNLGESNAGLVITAINYQQKTITGTFSFTGVMFTESGETTEETIAFSQGVFTNVLVTGNLVNPNPEDPDPEDPDPEDPDPEDPDPEDPEVPLSDDYFPMTSGNIWNYNNTALSIASTATIGGNTYYKLNGGFFAQDGHTSDSYIRKDDNGDYYLRVENEGFNQEGYSVNIDLVEYIMLKEYLNEGDTWEETLLANYTYTISGQAPVEQNGVPSVFQSIIEAKDVTEVVNGVTYENVIKVKTSNNSLFGTMTTEVWFAKNVGVIYHNAVGPQYSKTSLLVDYTLN